MEARAKRSATAAVAKLMALRPDTATRVKDGVAEVVSADLQFIEAVGVVFGVLVPDLALTQPIAHATHTPLLHAFWGKPDYSMIAEHPFLWNSPNGTTL
jgi:hypothetical protein